MKKVLSSTFALLLLATAAPAVTWDLVSLSVVVRQGNPTGNTTATTLNSRKYLNYASARFGVPLADLFVGLREDTGQVSIVQRSTKTVLYNIVSGLATQGVASNATTTTQAIAASATVSSTGTDFTGFVYDSLRRNANGSIRSVSRLMIGGFATQTLRGSCVTTGRKIEL